MSHPDDLLIDYVDDTLGPDARAEVEAHLGTCARCREQVQLTRAGAQALATLPPAEPPADLAAAAIAEAEGRAAERAPEVAGLGTPRRRPGTPRWVAVVGAAAVIALVALIAPKLGQAPTTSASRSAAAAAVGAAAPATAVEIQHANYTFSGLTGFAQSFRSVARGANVSDGAAAQDAGGPQPRPTKLGESTEVPPVAASASLDVDQIDTATACLNQAFNHPEGELVRVVRARFQGTPAYFGVYLISPGAGLPPNLLRLNVASVDGCTIRGSSQVNL
jgi:Putative zinc-finger